MDRPIEDLFAPKDNPLRVGRYIAKIIFGPNRSLHGPSLCGITVLDRGESPTVRSPQASILWCGLPTLVSDDKRVLKPGVPGCGHLIMLEHTSGDKAVCSNCGRVIHRSQWITLKVAMAAVPAIAEELERVVLDTKFDIDLMIIDDPVNRSILLQEHKGLTPDLIEKEKIFVYPRYRLEKDLVKSGANLRGRLEAFLRA